MPLIAKKTSYEKHPAGMFAAVCYQVIDLGTHLDPHYGKRKRLVRINFETTEEMRDGRPFSIGVQTTLSLSEKARLTALLESWRGRKFTDEELSGFDLKNVLGKSCFLNIAHDGEYANILSISPLAKGTQPVKPQNEIVMLSLDDFDQAVYNGLSQYLKKKIDESDERTGNGPKPEAEQPAGEADADAAFDDASIPF